MTRLVARAVPSLSFAAEIAAHVIRYTTCTIPQTFTQTKMAILHETREDGVGDLLPDALST